MSEELKPCPFCKAEPISEDNRRFFLKHKPECFLAHPLHNADFHIVSTGPITDHIKTWNTRLIEDEKDMEIAELKEALKAFIKWDKDYPVGYNPMTGLHEFNSLITNAEFLLWRLEKTGKDNDVTADGTDINVESMEE